MPSGAGTVDGDARRGGRRCRRPAPVTARVRHRAGPGGRRRDAGGGAAAVAGARCGRADLQWAGARAAGDPRGAVGRHALPRPGAARRAGRRPGPVRRPRARSSTTSSTASSPSSTSWLLEPHLPGACRCWKRLIDEPDSIRSASAHARRPAGGGHRAASSCPMRARHKEVSPAVRPDARTLHTRVRHADAVQPPSWAPRGCTSAGGRRPRTRSGPAGESSPRCRSHRRPGPPNGSRSPCSRSPPSTTSTSSSGRCSSHELTSHRARRGDIPGATHGAGGGRPTTPPGCSTGPPTWSARRVAVPHGRDDAQGGVPYVPGVHPGRERDPVREVQAVRDPVRTPAPARLASPAFDSVPAVRGRAARPHPDSLMAAWLDADRRLPGDPALARVTSSMAALEAAHRRWKGTHVTVATPHAGRGHGGVRAPPASPT